MTGRAKPTIEQRPMACVSIDHSPYLLPFADAQKLLEIMSRAIVVHDKRYRDGGDKYELAQRKPHLRLEVVMPEQVVMNLRDADATSTVGQIARLGHVRGSAP